MTAEWTDKQEEKGEVTQHDGGYSIADDKEKKGRRGHHKAMRRRRTFYIFAACDFILYIYMLFAAACAAGICKMCVYVATMKSLRCRVRLPQSQAISPVERDGQKGGTS